MDFCNICRTENIDRLIEECCGSHPETGKTASLNLKNGEVASACPELDPEGGCKTYDSRPYQCRQHLCGETDLTSIFTPEP
jgi:Fe-S-cluster containining protein|tara:strand:- start:1321 stop:1563 length:243 start_codon:yes stop_codon:yes gene_type:complete